MNTLWIDIRLLCTGKTAWVITDGRLPYKSGTRLPVGEYGIEDRYTREGCQNLFELAERPDIEQIRVLEFALTTVSKEVERSDFLMALDPTNIPNDPLPHFMPNSQFDLGLEPS